MSTESGNSKKEGNLKKEVLVDLNGQGMLCDISLKIMETLQNMEGNSMNRWR